MGCMSSKSICPIELPKHQIVYKLSDIHYSLGYFVHRNFSSFYTLYMLLPDPLGTGPYGEVRKCIHKPTDTIRAVKILNKHTLPKNFMRQEGVINQIRILKTLDHPNIMRVYEFFEDNSSYFVVEEYYPGVDLLTAVEKVKKYNEPQVREIMKQLFSAISYLHCKKVVHRDLKPENIILEENKNSEALSIKVIDFDSATFFNREKPMKGLFGTVYYIAPEVINSTYDEKCDIWSLGVIMYILLSGRAPFFGLSEFSILKKVKQGEFSFEGQLWENISESAKDLIRKMLTKDPSQRISANDAYNHSWIQNPSAPQPPLAKNPFIIPRIKRHHSHPKLKDAVKSFIISQILKRDDLKSLESAFIEMDLDGNGTISKYELESHLRNFMDDDSAKQEANLILSNEKLLDHEYLSYSDFLNLVTDQHIVFSKENLQKTFKIIDRDHNGKISSQDLEKFILEDEKLDKESLDKITHEMDPENKGEIEFAEFENSFIHRYLSRKYTITVDMS
ncbi:unnamed protein product [Blepharisma stoltei]|uniref:non-specific serine/threonine protein kinase n=1 Tax=Blepharisma stoltei TaxID=1481888 RepID=A0AAU9JLA5_9CILI|nr:unnamed protein product [Blepharisma stoltei]